MNAGQVDRVWDIIEKAGVGMLTTQFSGGLRARPSEAATVSQAASSVPNRPRSGRMTK